MLGSGMNLITTAIGFGMSVTFIVFICTRLICGRIRAAGSRRLFEIESRIDLEQPGHSTRGLQPDIVAAIPTLKFNQDTFSSTDDTQCTICLGEYEEKEVLRIMPKCGHNFHLSCIDIWLRIQTTCPVCRLPLNSSINRIQNRPTELGTHPSISTNPEIIVERSQQMLLHNGSQLDQDTDFGNIELTSDVPEINLREETR